MDTGSDGVPPPPRRSAPLAAPAAFYEELVHIASYWTGTGKGSLYLVAEDGRHLVLQASVGLPAEWVAAARRVPIRPGGLPCGEAAATNQPVATGDFSKPPLAAFQTLATRSGIQAILAHPLLGSAGRSLGVLASYYGASGGLPSVRALAGFHQVARHLASLIEHFPAPPPPAGAIPGAPPPAYPGQRGKPPCSLARGLLLALEARGVEPVGHRRRVTTYTILLAEALGIPKGQLPPLAWGAALHDIGTIGIPDDILRKPGKLLPEETAAMRRHPEIGARMVKPLAHHCPEILHLVLYHHERPDGRGYPAGLVGGEIPLPARIFAVVDAFDAMTSDRPYRRGGPIEAARRELAAHRGTQFCPRCTDAFLSLDPQVLHAVQQGKLDLFDGYISLAP